jgi:hypothetical protein
MRYTSKVGQEGSRGSALITLMIIILLVSIAGASMVGFAKQQVFAVSKVRDYLKAQAYAEAGANEAYNTLKTNFALRSDPANFPPRTFGDGGYAVGVQSVSDTLASITSTGTIGSVISVVKMDVKNFNPGATGWEVQPTDPYAYSWLVNGICRMNGSSVFGGYVHANNGIDVNGLSTWGEPTNEVRASASVSAVYSGPCTLHGTLRAPAISGSFAPGTATEAASPIVPIPPLDLAQLFQTALDNGQVVNSQTINANTTWNIPGGVKWINGTLLVKSTKKLTYTGCVIATGAITIQGNGILDATPVAGKPVLVSRDSSVSMGKGVARGILRSAGDMTFSGGCDFRGTIFCGGNLTFNGSGDRFSYENYGPGSGGGGGEGTSADLVGVTAWQK